MHTVSARESCELPALYGARLGLSTFSATRDIPPQRVSMLNRFSGVKMTCSLCSYVVDFLSVV